MIDRVVIEPGHGAVDEEGNFDYGNMSGTLTEYDLVQAYAQTAAEELALSRCRVEILPTRHRPGLRPSQRLSRVSAQCLLLSLHIGWNAKPRAENASALLFSSPLSRTVAEHIQGGVERWGKITSPSHGQTVIREFGGPMLSIPGTVALHVEPFALNGPNAMLYAQRMEQFGTALGRAVAELLEDRYPGAFVRPSRQPVR
jgi:N-acetylmuramoyl-L-alanine amidase